MKTPMVEGTHAYPAPQQEDNMDQAEDTLQVQLLSPWAKLPTRATPEAAGYNVFTLCSIDLTSSQDNTH